VPKALIATAKRSIAAKDLLVTVSYGFRRQEAAGEGNFVDFQQCEPFLRMSIRKGTRRADGASSARVELRGLLDWGVMGSTAVAHTMNSSVRSRHALILASASAYLDFAYLTNR
jgi:hypothetical protein